MKISNSKKELARIISENGGWFSGATWAVQNGEHGRISFSGDKPARHGNKSWMAGGGFQFKIEVCKPLRNWHQAILSRSEYFFLHQEQGLEDDLNEDWPDADGWIEWKGGECPVEKGTLVDVRFKDGMEMVGAPAGQTPDHFPRNLTHWGPSCAGTIIAYRLHKPEQSKPEFCESVVRSIPEPEAKPTIEQLAADYRNAKDYAERKQQEADDAKADADAKLKALEIAGEAIGFIITPITDKQEPELVITDWRDLQVGDVIELTGSVNPCWKEHSGSEMTVKEVFRDQGDNDDQVDLIGESGCWSLGGNTTWRFIRRP